MPGYDVWTHHGKIIH
jgi:hypothetical protein